MDSYLDLQVHASQYANPLSSIWSITSLQHPYILHVKGVPWPNKLKFSRGHSKDAETELKDRGMTELISLHEKAFEVKAFCPLHWCYFILLSSISAPHSQEALCFYFNACQPLPPTKFLLISSIQEVPVPYVCPHGPLHYVWSQHPIENWILVVACYDNKPFMSPFEKAFKTPVFISNYR